MFKAFISAALQKLTIDVIIGSILLVYYEITDLIRRLKGQNLLCQLDNEYDLQSKSVIKEIVLRIVFYI